MRCPNQHPADDLEYEAVGAFGPDGEGEAKADGRAHNASEDAPEDDDDDQPPDEGSLTAGDAPADVDGGRGDARVGEGLCRSLRGVVRERGGDFDSIPRLMHRVGPTGSGGSQRCGTRLKPCPYDYA